MSSLLDNITANARTSNPVDVDLLDADPDLFEGLADKHRQHLDGGLRVPVLVVRKGRWEPADLDPGTIGLLVLEGLMMRRVSLGRVSSSELLGPGDILRPGDDGLLPEVHSHSSAWRALTDSRVAVIDRRATETLGSSPELSAAIASRLLRRSRCLAYLMAAQHFRRIDDVLLATLWHIAAMWGKVCAEGVTLPFNFTHATLAELIGARRPTVTVTIQALENQRRLGREGRGRWVLLGGPPEWHPETIDQNAAALIERRVA